MKKNLRSKVGIRLRNFLIGKFPLAMHSASGVELVLRNKSEIRLYEQMFVTNSYDLHGLKKLLRVENPVIFDIGANCGFFTIRALDVWPDAVIFAFEPQRGFTAELSELLLRNDLADHVTCLDSAIGKNEGTMVFYENRSPQGSSLVKEKVKRKKLVGKYLVEVLSLDSYVNANNINHIDILKVDVEGGELGVLEGARQILRTVSALFIEVHPPFASAAQVESVVSGYGLSRARELEDDRRHDKDLVFINSARISDDRCGPD